MRGDKIIASVPKGQQVVVVEVRDPWLGIYVSIGDQKKAGWMRTTAFIPAAGGDQPGYVTAGYDVKPEGSPQVTLATKSQSVRRRRRLPPTAFQRERRIIISALTTPAITRGMRRTRTSRLGNPGCTVAKVVIRA